MEQHQYPEGYRRELPEPLNMKCIGCDSDVQMEVGVLFAYTCSCGATVFYGEGGRLSIPASLTIALAKGKPLPHIDYYVGTSGHTSKIKEEFIKQLRDKGAIWSWECDRCRDQIVNRKIMQKEMGLLRSKLHPDLEKLMGN